ncbi:MAG: HDOD domain-containing protein, partial [Gammaproteobacteria bacterium]|nr:HDOD domain-containing protein [Gammaproteobacteria bacterium]
MTETDTVILGPDYQTVRSAAQAFAAELERSVARDEIELPSLPEVALKIRRAISRDDVDMDQLASLAGTDPALAAQLIKLANSGLYARGSKPLTNLRTAVLRLGSQMVRNISIALAAQQVFLGYGSASIHPNLRRTWRHSLHTAALSHL